MGSESLSLMSEVEFNQGLLNSMNIPILFAFKKTLNVQKQLYNREGRLCLKLLQTIDI